MTTTDNIRNLYFLGIGGIGMSALARYFHRKGYKVAGYDRTKSPLTHALEEEGIHIVYDGGTERETEKIAAEMPKPETLVVRTPAVPEDEEIYTWLREQDYTIMKRAELLGLISRMPHSDGNGNIFRMKALCVAGTHGKTTTSAMLAHIMHNSSKGANAFLGGISNNINSNLLTDEKSEYVVVEADEFDRSFHHLTPYMSVITSIDPDHLDIYGNEEAYQEGFDKYAGLVENTIILNKRYTLHNATCRIFTYSATEDADFRATDIKIEDGEITFNIHTPECTTTEGTKPAAILKNIRLGVPAWINIENSIAATAVAWLNGVTEEEIRQGIASFKGVYRRFDRHIDIPRLTYIDDYAHHPTELAAAISSVKQLYPDRLLTIIFQPHLYTRTRDFMDDFAKVLSVADELLLLPIYPAREKPITGITSELLAEKCRRLGEKNTEVTAKTELANRLRNILAKDNRPRVIMTLGAGDIDRLVPQLTKLFSTL